MKRRMFQPQCSILIVNLILIVGIVYHDLTTILIILRQQQNKFIAQDLHEKTNTSTN